MMGSFCCLLLVLWLVSSCLATSASTMATAFKCREELASDLDVIREVRLRPRATETFYKFL